MRNNIIVSSSIVVLMVVLGAIAGCCFSSYVLVMVIAFSWGLGGIWIKALNEAWLPLEKSHVSRRAALVVGIVASRGVESFGSHRKGLSPASCVLFVFI